MLINGRIIYPCYYNSVGTLPVHRMVSWLYGSDGQYPSRFMRYVEKIDCYLNSKPEITWNV